MKMVQLELDFEPAMTVKVGCRMGGEIQHYMVDCDSVREARNAVSEANDNQATPILAVVEGGKKDDKLVQTFSHTSAPQGPARA